VCVLNACQSGKQIQLGIDSNDSIDERETSLGARLMDAGMQMVVAMGYSVTVSAAKLFLEQMYGQLFGQQPLSEAVRRGRKELFERKQRQVYYNQVVDLEDWLLPVVYANQDVDFRLRPMTFQEEEDYFTQQATQYRFGGTEYDFVGRDLDILKLEKALLRHNVLLLQGMGGTGKTTLLRYLQDWWVQTHFVDRVFYFGYDQRARTLAQILHSIGQAVYPDAEQRVFQAMPVDAQREKLVKTLRSARYGLVLDNLESVTGQALAIQNTLPPEEQTLIQQFLGQLSGGQTLVLLGSRSPEEWLKGIYKQNRYELRGLDNQARTELAQKVLARHISDGGRRAELLKERDFRRLMDLLAGYPLAIEVMLANLARQGVAELLSGLLAADVSLDREGDKTESILKCVEYSYSNLSPDAQKLLLCLALFSGFIHRLDLQNYGTVLQKLEPFKDYPFEQFDRAVQEAINWGLLSRHELDAPGLLTIHPVFPYFLKTKLEMQTVDIQVALREGFKTHYQRLAGVYQQWMESQDPQARKIGLFLCKVEYENLCHALQISLERQESADIFFCLYAFFDGINDIQSKLTLSEFVSEQHEKYPPELHTGEIGLEIILSLGQLANCYQTKKNYRLAKIIYKKVLGLCEQLEGIDKNQKLSIQATTYHQMGILAHELQDFDNAQHYYQQALDIFIKSGNRLNQAVTYQQMGRINHDLKNLDKARDYYQQALVIFIEYDNRLYQANTYCQMGKIDHDLQDLDKARDYYQQSLDIYIKCGDLYAQASIYGQLGMVAHELEDFNNAQQYYKLVLGIFIEYGDLYSQAITYNHLGSLAIDEENYPEASIYLIKSLSIFVDFQDNYSIKMTILDLAHLHKTTQDQSLLISISQILDMSIEQVQKLFEE
jgi:tetratricopeptide (TPR) repeat protein